jgi:RND family efflux transporter MFP subunit
VRRRRDAEVEAAKANYDQAKADYDVDILAAKAEIAAAEAAVRDAEINLGYCRMYAPIEGRIGEAKVKVGNLVGPLAGGDYTELATIQQLDPMGIDIQVSSRYLARATELIQRGLTMRLTRPSVEGDVAHPQEGKAFFIDNAIDPTTSTFLVKAEIPNPDMTLLPGEYVKLDMVVGDVPDALVVPEQAVIETQGGEMVYVVDDQGTVGIARVTATYTYEGLRVIESGLKEGAKVVVEGIQLVRPGMKVKVGEMSGGEEVSRKGAKGAEKQDKGGEEKDARE